MNYALPHDEHFDDKAPDKQNISEICALSFCSIDD